MPVITTTGLKQVPCFGFGWGDLAFVIHTPSDSENEGRIYLRPVKEGEVGRNISEEVPEFNPEDTAGMLVFMNVESLDVFSGTLTSLRGMMVAANEHRILSADASS